VSKSPFEHFQIFLTLYNLKVFLSQACESLSRGLERTASSLIGNPVKAYQRGAGTSTAVASALRAAPAAAVAPAVAAAGAMHRALLGVQNR
jgi:autophagy-related protein 2